METTMTKPLPAVLLGLALLATSAWATDGRPIDERRPLKPDARVAVSNVAGSIEVEAWDKNELHLTGTLAEEVEKLEITGSESSLRIEVKLPKRTKHTGDTDLKLKVPAGISLDANGVSADITARGLRGEIEANSVSGDIKLDVASKRIEAQSVSGDVTVRAPSTETRVDSVSGDVIVHGARGELRGKSVSGDVQIQAREVKQLDVETVSGDVELELDLVRDARVNAESLSGCVRLAVSRMPDGELEMETFSGELESGWSPIPDSAREFRHEGDGKGRVRLHSFSGDISLTKR